MKKYLLTPLLAFSLSFTFAQNTTRTDAPADTVKKPEKVSLNLATIYATDASYYGQTSTERLPYVLANASLNFPGGFYISGGAYKLINVGSGISGVDLSAGFDFDLSKNLSAGLSFTRSFFPENSSLLQSANLNIASGSLTYDWQSFTTGLSADFALGSPGALFTTLNATKSFDLGSLFSPKDYISFEPAFDLVGGTQTITTTEQVPPSGSGGRFLPILTGGKTSKPQYREVQKTSFDLISYNLKLPLAYNRANYAIEATYQGSILSNKVEGATGNINSFLYLGLYYIFK